VFEASQLESLVMPVCEADIMLTAWQWKHIDGDADRTACCLCLCCSWTTGFTMRSHTRFRLLDRHTHRSSWKLSSSVSGVGTTVTWRWPSASGTFLFWTELSILIQNLHSFARNIWLCTESDIHFFICHLLLPFFSSIHLSFTLLPTACA